MLSKLLKRDLKRNMRWMWILFVSTIAIAGITRGCKELGKTIGFFNILGIFFDSVFYALAVNVVLQAFLRNFLNFKTSFYSDESYLTHTLPINKNTLINSKYLTALIEVICGFATLVLSILILFISPSFFDTIHLLLSTVISGSFSVGLVLTLFIALVIVEFLMFLSIIFFGIVMAYKCKEHRVLKTFLISALMAFASLTVLAIIMLVVLAIQGINLSSSTLILPFPAFISVVITGIVVYSTITVLFYFLTKHEFNKGVNVD